MLQQTRVEAVKPYFQRFMETLPDIAALAQAPEEVLLKLWEGLGYYNRVRNLQKAAIQIMEDYGGVMPDSYEELLKLKRNRQLYGWGGILYCLRQAQSGGGRQCSESHCKSPQG